MADLKLQSEKKELKAGDIIGYLHGGEGEPVPMRLTQETIDTVTRLHKELNLDGIDDRIICSANPQQLKEMRELHESWRIESKLKEIVPYWGVYSKTAQSDMTLCYQKGLEQKEQYAKEQVLKELLHLHRTPFISEKDRSNAIYNRLVNEINKYEKELQVKP